MMKLDTKIASLNAPLSLCLKCGMCIYGEWPESPVLCPIYFSYKKHIASAGGMISFLKTVADNKINYTPAIAQYAYECPTCGVCDMCELVPIPAPHARPTEFIRFLRYNLVKEGLVPSAKIREMHKQIHEKGDYAGTVVSLPEKIKDCF